MELEIQLFVGLNCANGENSKLRELLCGVPQGSVLGKCCF